MVSKLVDSGAGGSAAADGCGGMQGAYRASLTTTWSMELSSSSSSVEEFGRFGIWVRVDLLGLIGDVKRSGQNSQIARLTRFDPHSSDYKAIKVAQQEKFPQKIKHQHNSLTLGDMVPTTDDIIDSMY